MIDRNKISHYLKLWTFIEKEEKKEIAKVFILSLIASLLEVFSIGAIIPFLAILNQPENFLNNLYVRNFISIFKLHQTEDIVLFITIFFCTAVITSGFVRFNVFLMQSRLSQTIGSKLSFTLYKSAINQSYLKYLNLNTSTIISAITTKVNRVSNNVILPILNLASSSIIFIFILGSLLYFEPVVTSIALISIFMIYVVIFFLTKNIMIMHSKVVNEESSRVIKILQEGLGAIRNVLIDKTQDFYLKIFSEADYKSRMSTANISVISASPRYFVESLSIVVLICIAYFFTKNNALNSNVIPMIGMLGLGAQRLLPNIQQIYLSFNQIKSSNPALVDVLNFINLNIPKKNSTSRKPLKLLRNFVLKNVYFKYAKNSDWILKDINLIIKKGACIGVVGSSGSGKSTLMDILLGLLLPTKGKVLLDGKSLNAHMIDSFQAVVAHVPQNIFLADASIAENIAFGIALDDINMDLVKIVAKKAQISEFIESLPNQYLAMTGEKGARMSGGQKQRIGFARALYKNADILILDEVTSSLDIKTEKSVMKTIENIKKDMTVLIVSHSHTILKVCDEIVELDNGGLKKYTYNQFVKLYKE